LLVGAGVGKPWFYEALYHTNFHYGEERLGLDPHNSFLNTLYRFGLVGFGLLIGAIVSTLVVVIKALRRSATGDVLLEGLTLYFFYTVIFSNFTVALEGPAYSMPFWLTLGLMYARARQLLFAADSDLIKMPEKS
jgi:O-antigen ligase